MGSLGGDPKEAGILKNENRGDGRPPKEGDPGTPLGENGVTTSYTYNAAGQRVRKVSSTGPASTVVFAYDQAGHLLGEYDQNGAALREYVWLRDTPMAMFTPDPANPTGEPLVFYIHTDHLNTPRVVVDRQNRVRWRWLAEPFGTTAPETDPSGLGVFTQNLRFPGQYADQESGLFYNWNRYYDQKGGIYTQSDPIGLTSGSLSTYAYVDADPLSFVDPGGLAKIKLGGENITVHKNDVDPWPSSPHGHIYDKSHVVDVEGNIFNKNTGQVVGKLSKKETLLWKKFLEKAGHSVKCFAPFILVYDVISKGPGAAINGALWPVSELWSCEECEKANASSTPASQPPIEWSKGPSGRGTTTPPPSLLKKHYENP